MTYHSQLNWIMLVTVIGLAIFLYLRPEIEALQEYKVSIHPIETVESIRIVRNEKAITLKHLDSYWRLVKPISARADESKVNQMLDILSANSNKSFPLTEQTHLGLDQPIVELYIDDVYFGFGGLAPTTNLQYLITDNNIYLVSPRYAIQLPVNPLELISPNLLASDEIPVRFEIGNVVVHQQDEVWNIVSSNPEKVLSQDELKNWVHKWHTVNAATVAYHARLDSSLMDEDEDNKIKINLQSGQEIIFKLRQNDTEMALLRVDEGISYHLPVDIGKHLLVTGGIESDKMLSVD